MRSKEGLNRYLGSKEGVQGEERGRKKRKVERGRKKRRRKRKEERRTKEDNKVILYKSSTFWGR
jgi:hypothetical protein